MAPSLNISEIEIYADKILVNGVVSDDDIIDVVDVIIRIDKNILYNNISIEIVKELIDKILIDGAMSIDETVDNIKYSARYDEDGIIVDIYPNGIMVEADQ